MPKLSGSLTQSGADTATSLTVETGLTVDSKSGIEIYGMEVFWDNGESVAAGDWEINASIGTITGATSFVSDDEICRVSWGMQNTGGVAVAVDYEPVKSIILIEPRLTVQPDLFFTCASSLTGQANTIRVKIYYNVVKLTDLEVMRLLVGGA